MYIAWLDEPDARARAAVGGKAANLMSLVRAGFPVPDGFTVTADAFVRSLARHEADHRLAALFGRLEHDVIDDADQGDTTLAEAGARARAQVLDGGPDPHVEFEVRRAYRQLCERRGRDDVAVAVRSSASAEDQLDSSFAGQQDTYLWVRGEDEVVNRMVRCWASLFNDRALTYRLQRRYPLTAVAMAVVVQEMVEPVAAGVAFTLDPATGDRSKVAIDSAFGLGESVVSGQVTPDHFVVDTVVGVIVRRTISDKTCEIVVESDAVTTRPVDEARRRLPSVPDPTVLAIARLARRLERHFGRPQDIEWAVTIEPDSTARIAVLQSRPETSWSRRRLEDATAASPGTLLDGVVGALTASVAEPRPTWGVALTDSDGPRSTLPGPFSVPAPEGAEDWATMYDASLVFGEARREHEEAAFWFRDAVHWPRPLSPFDVTMLQFSLASLGQYNARHFLVPSALGIDCRVLNGYCYLSPIPVSDPLVVAERAAEFRERAGYYYEHWDELYGAWMVRVRSAIDRLEAISFSALGDAVDFDEVRRATGLGPPHHLMRS